MIEFVALTNPLQLGYGIWVMIDIQVEPTKIRRVARKLAEATEVYFVGITTGSHDISIGAIFKSTTELLQFITERLGKIPGIVRTTTSSVLEVVKRTWTHGLPIDVSDNGHRVRRRSIAAKAGKQN
jgi:Lrp/AsnC family transcriptional regulator for asnA, asnC and gidA